MRAAPRDLVEPDAGRVLVLVVCPDCNKVIGVVQERWTTETPRGELLDAWRLGGYFGKMQHLDGSRGHAVGSHPLRKVGEIPTDTTILCRRHGVKLADKRELAGLASEAGNAPSVVAARTLKRPLD